MCPLGWRQHTYLQVGHLTIQSCRHCQPTEIKRKAYFLPTTYTAYLNYCSILRRSRVATRHDNFLQNNHNIHPLSRPCGQDRTTSSNGNILLVAGPLCGELTRSFDIFFDLRLNKWLSKQSWRWWFEAPLWPFYDVTVLSFGGGLYPGSGY